jgi:RHS repeat-associated protein
LQYAGRENDGTGLYYNRARYYSPQFGRFISADPIGLGGGTNVYAYVNGNPLSLSDPLGLWAIYIGGLGSIFGGGLSAGAGGGFIFDSSGNLGTYQVVGVGGGVGDEASFGASFGVVTTSTSAAPAATIADFGGPFAAASAGFGLGPAVSIDGFADPDSPTVGGGITIGAGVGGGFTVQATNTTVTPFYNFNKLIPDILRLFGLHTGTCQ